jgi:hypothetical protein
LLMPIALVVASDLYNDAWPRTNNNKITTLFLLQHNLELPA